MRLFDKIFGARTEEKKIRAQYKDAKYFMSQIERCDRFIESDKQNEIEYLKSHDRLNSFHYLSSVTIRLKKIENIYSRGEDINKLVIIFKEATNFFSKGWSEHYQGYPLLLQMVSFAILLDVEDGEMKKIKDFLKKAEESSIEEIWKPDSLVYFLIGENTERTGDTPYQKLYEISKLSKPEAESAIEKYLDKWYGMHKDDPWYNTHLRDKGYSGYWAWEVGAFVKVMGLDDSRFKDNIYYPYDMVHWKE
ncbi:DUF1911 domain-containing protein [Pedobacter jeongneungensis]|uniref:DUF1911 domain-containing protein n=1 Tax=Pedobacter jeongneungensis TaxID=947309 RepID=A0ABP8BIR6_9SPHI